MKKLVAGACAVLFAGAFSAAQAQDNRTQKTDSKDMASARTQQGAVQARRPVIQNGIAMVGGTMVLVKEGRYFPFEETKLSNGATVSYDGTLRHSDGRTEIIQEGEAIDMNGVRQQNQSLMKQQVPGEE